MPDVRRRSFTDQLGIQLIRTAVGAAVGAGQALEMARLAAGQRSSAGVVQRASGLFTAEGLSSGTTSATSHTFTVSGIGVGWLVVASAQVETDPPGPAFGFVGLAGSSPEVSGVNGVTSFTVSDDDLEVVVANEDGSSRNFRLDVYARPL